MGEPSTEVIETLHYLIQRLCIAADYKDHETGQHISRIGQYSRLMAAQYGLDTATAEILFRTAPMHDIGKVGIADSILMKPGKLNEAEWEIMKYHTVFGAEIIGQHQNRLLVTAREIALHHHERWDGSGYPSGLKEETIPLSARIVSVCDVYDALVSKRHYKKAWKHEDAAQYISAQGGSQFDPALVNVFQAVYPQIRKAYDESIV